MTVSGENHINWT